MNCIQKIVAKIGVDKIAHFAVSAFLVLALGCFVHWAIAAGVVIILGVAKELWDGAFNKKDLLADALGVLVATLFLLVG